MSQAGYTPISLYYSTTAAAAPSAGNLANGELAVNITDGKLFYKDNGGVVRVLATAAGSAGDVVGPGSSTDNALVRFDGTTGKLVQNSAGVLDDSGNLTGLASVTATTLTGALTGSVGATTPNTGAFTTLSASGAVTLSGGTANGVAYLNGSKVLTSGSALTFDGTNFVVGNATAANGRIRYQNATNDAYGEISIVGGADFRIESTYGSTAGYKPITFYTNGSEQMRLTSTGLGIGTSSPAYKLDVSGDIRAQNGDVISRNSAAAQSARFGYNAWYSSGGFNLVTDGATPLTFGTNQTERARIDSSGNLGLGVTPSASWASSQGPAFQIGAFTSVFNNAYLGSAEFAYNTARNGNDTYVYVNSSVAASRLQQRDGTFRFWTAPSGTAGNAISFSQAMTLDASGNLIVGATSGFTKIDVRGTSNTAASTIQITGNTVSSLLLGQNADGGVVRGQGGNNALTFWTGGSGDTGAGQSGSERARIDSSGNFRVGIGTSTTNTYMDVNHATGSTSGASFFVARYNGTQIGDIAQNGTTAVLYNTTSDYRLKTVIGAVTGAGERIDALEPVEYEWKSDGSRTRGFLAHKFQEVYAGSVTGSKDAVDNDGNPIYQAMQAGSSEVIADLVAEIQSLRQRLAALEAA